MAFEVPTAIADFFTKYPSALEVFCVEGRKSYLNHFQDKALLDAKINEAKLFRVADDLSWTTVYPPLSTYVASVTPTFTKVYCNAYSVTLTGEYDTEDVELAMLQACEGAGVTVESVLVEIEGEKYKMTIQTYEIELVTFKMGDTALQKQ